MSSVCLCFVFLCSRYKMLKWAVYGKKNQDNNQANNSESDEYEDCRKVAFDNTARRSLDAETVKKSKKPSRYQRRSLGANARKNNALTADKENLNYIGCTPNYFKEGFIKKTEGLALKDVSNITPNSVTPVKSYERRKFYFNSPVDDIPADLPPTPPTYSRRVREAKKRKLEMTCVKNNNNIFSRDNCIYRSERRISVDRNSLSSPRLSHSTSEPSLNDLSDRLSAVTTNNRHSIALSKIKNNKPVCTTKTTSEGLVEIEYDKDIVINCIENPVEIDKSREGKTLPIFGHHIFMENPLYFNKHENGINDIRPLKRTRKKSNEFQSSFISPSVDKRDTHTLVREACSPMSITPLSLKLAELRFSTMSTHTKSQRVPFTNDISEYFPKIEIPFTDPVRDEEVSTEMENKFILGKDSIAHETESTVSTTEMGDVTLERMIEDIIKSTKIVKTKRRVLNGLPTNRITIDEELLPTLEAVKDLFVNPQAENKAKLIKEAKYVNLSRENSISPKNSPVKKKKPIHRVNDRLLKNLPIGCFILDDGDGYNEREVCTPENVISIKSRAVPEVPKRISLVRSISMCSSMDKSSLEDLSGSTPDLYSAANHRASLRLKRQRCIRRKKSTVSNKSQLKPNVADPKISLLTLEIGLPSPASELPNTSLCEPLNSPLCYPLATNDDFLQFPNNSIRSNVSHSSLMPNVEPGTGEHFGLTLLNGIPSPITPVPNLKRPGKVMSEERAHKTSKLDEELLTDGYTPLIEHKSIRRCLTYSLEETSITSSEEKRSSVASNRLDALDRSADRFQALKGTIDLEIMTRNDVIDVHGEW